MHTKCRLWIHEKKKNEVKLSIWKMNPLPFYLKLKCSVILRKSTEMCT